MSIFPMRPAWPWLHNNPSSIATNRTTIFDSCLPASPPPCSGRRLEIVCFALPVTSLSRPKNTSLTPALAAPTAEEPAWLWSRSSMRD